MLKTLVVTLLALTVVVASAAAQTSPASSPNQGAYDKLSAGNQKIAQALYDGQQQSGTTKPLTTSPYSLDDIAAMKQHKGWGEIFKEMKASGQIPADVKNLGQLVSGRYQSGTSSGTTITTASGRSTVVGHKGKLEPSDTSGRSGLDNDASSGNAGSGGNMSGPSRGNGYGQSDSSAAGGLGRSGVSGQSGGRGK